MENSHVDLTHDDDTLFDDDTGYSQQSAAPIMARADADAVSLVIDSNYLEEPLARGDTFTLHGATYRVVSVDRSGAETMVGFSPPLERPAMMRDEIVTT